MGQHSSPTWSRLIFCFRNQYEVCLQCFKRDVRLMSRTTTTTPELLTELAQAPWAAPRGALVAWLQNPVLDWDLPLKVVDCSRE